MPVQLRLLISTQSTSHVHRGHFTAMRDRQTYKVKRRSSNSTSPHGRTGSFRYSTAREKVPIWSTLSRGVDASISPDSTSESEAMGYGATMVAAVVNAEVLCRGGIQ